MANRPAPALVLRDGDREQIEAWLRSRSVKAGLVKRARFSTDPNWSGRSPTSAGSTSAPVKDIRANAIVLSVDENPRSRRFDRTVPILPMQEGRIERRSHDYYGHGTTTLFAALEIATDQVGAALRPKHRHQEFLAFLRQIERA